MLPEAKPSVIPFEERHNVRPKSAGYVKYLKTHSQKSPHRLRVQRACAPSTASCSSGCNPA